ncbi:hypothetical protein ACFX2A_023849 [Malus domestica]
METTITASHECYLWLGSLTNKKLNLKGGDKVRVHADFIETEDDHQIKVKKTGVDIVEWDFVFTNRTKVDYKRVPYESDEDTDEEEDYQTAPYESDEEEDYQTAPCESDEEASDDDKELSNYSSDEVQPCKRFEVI